MSFVLDVCGILRFKDKNDYYPPIYGNRNCKSFCVSYQDLKNRALFLIGNENINGHFSYQKSTDIFYNVYLSRSLTRVIKECT